MKEYFLPQRKYQNSQPNSYIGYCCTYTGEGIGLVGSSFVIYDENIQKRLEFPQDQIADFLNDAIGKDGSARTISEEIKNAVKEDFADVLKIENGKYVYTGRASGNKYGAFSGLTYKETMEKYNQIKEANLKTQPEKRGEFTKEEVRAVLQNEVAITNAKSTQPVLATEGFVTCVAVAAWNPVTKNTLLTHVDSYTDLNSLKQHLYTISSDRKLQVHLRGGIAAPGEGEERTLIRLLKMLKTLDNVKIKSADVDTMQSNSSDVPMMIEGDNRVLYIKSLAIDSRNGEIFTDFPALEVDKDLDIKMSIVTISARIGERPLKLRFDGRELPEKRPIVGEHTASIATKPRNADDPQKGNGAML